VLSLRNNSPYSVISNPGTEVDCLVAETRRLVSRHSLTTTKAVHYFTQNRSDCVCNVPARPNCAGGDASAGTSSNSSEFLFNGA
jgi:hypothetical protein